MWFHWGLAKAEHYGLKKLNGRYQSLSKHSTVFKLVVTTPCMTSSPFSALPRRAGTACATSGPGSSAQTELPRLTRSLKWVCDCSKGRCRRDQFSRSHFRVTLWRCYEDRVLIAGWFWPMRGKNAAGHCRSAPEIEADTTWRAGNKVEAASIPVIPKPRDASASGQDDERKEREKLKLMPWCHQSRLVCVKLLTNTQESSDGKRAHFA